MNIPGRRISQNEILITEAFPRGGDGMFLRVQMVDKNGTTTNGMDVDVYTRNREDSWPGSYITNARLEIPTGTIEGDILELHIPPSSTDAAGIKEELRLKITGVDTDGWMTIRVLPPLFYDAAIGTA